MSSRGGAELTSEHAVREACDDRSERHVPREDIAEESYLYTSRKDGSLSSY